jgi:sigma-54 dependent transcriptional regulator, acetoin dehydrogenase operon transcriptional activator AcoR
LTNGPNTLRSTHLSDSSEQQEERRENTAFLVRVLECTAPFAGASRHRLRGVDEVRIVRGERDHERTSESGRSLLTLSVPDPKLSSRHACLRRQFGSWLLEDLNSTNGTFVDGQRVTSHELSDGDMIELGSTMFLFVESLAARSLAADLSVRPSERGALTTLNPALDEVFTRLTRVAASELPVLLLGETGTGKDLLARAVHQLSGRSGRFVPVNCGAIPSTLMESQLFGHAKGAFTGAAKDELGFVRSAAFGTLFLDEIGDMATGSQAALLRVLQSGEVTPVGSTQPVHTDVRVIAATHQNLEQLMEAGTFRRDLYARLAGFVNQVPPLRERREDLGILIGALLKEQATAANLRIKLDAGRALFRHDWPLNVRELGQCLAAALVLSEGEVIGLAHLPDSVRRSTSSWLPSPGAARPSQPIALSAEDEAIQASLLKALNETEGNVSETARRLGKARQQVQRWLRRFAIDPSRFRKLSG